MQVCINVTGPISRKPRQPHFLFPLRHQIWKNKTLTCPSSRRAGTEKRLVFFAVNQCYKLANKDPTELGCADLGATEISKKDEPKHPFSSALPRLNCSAVLQELHMFFPIAVFGSLLITGFQICMVQIWQIGTAPHTAAGSVYNLYTIQPGSKPREGNPHGCHRTWKHCRIGTFLFFFSLQK